MVKKYLISYRFDFFSFFFPRFFIIPYELFLYYLVKKESVILRSNTVRSGSSVSERANGHADRQSFFNRLAVVSASGCFSIVWRLFLLLGISAKLHHLLYREYIERLNIVHSKEHKKNV